MVGLMTLTPNRFFIDWLLTLSTKSARITGHQLNRKIKMLKKLLTLCFVSLFIFSIAAIAQPDPNVDLLLYNGKIFRQIRWEQLIKRSQYGARKLLLLEIQVNCV